MPAKIIEEFSVAHLGILDETGKVDEELEPKLSRDHLVKIYRAMVVAREADQRMLKLQRQGRLGTFGPCSGQEASCVGPAFAMGAKDWFVGSFRELGGRLIQGESLTSQLLYWNGYEEGNLRTANSRVLPVSVIVGSQTLHAAGIAYALKYRREDAAVVCFLGDGATSEGDFHEAMNFASVWQVPMVFICQNNQWAISVPRSRQTRSKTLAQKAIAYDMACLQVDGNDVLATYQATREALDRARAGEGPTFIEAITYRLMMHTTADDPKRYRSDEEVAEWQGREPLIRFRSYLEAKGYWDEQHQAALDEEVRGEIEAAVQEFEARSDFKPDAPFDHVYGTTHPIIEEQRTQFLADLEQEVGHV